MSGKNFNKNSKQKSRSPGITTAKKVASNKSVSAKDSKEIALYYYIGLGIVLLLIYLIRKNYLGIPFERDEGAYAYAGRGILDGAIPFKDIGTQRLDGVLYAYAVIVGIFGYTVQALHGAFLIINLASASMLFFLGRKLGSNLAGLAAAIIFALLSMTATLSGFTIQSEHLVAFFSIAAFLALFHYFEKKKIWQLIISGVLFSFAFQIKQTSFFYGFLAGALLLFKLFTDDKKNIKKLIVAALVFAASILIPVLIDLVIIYKKGAWDDFNLWFFEIRNQYTSLISFDQGLDFLRQSFGDIYKDYKAFWIFSFTGTVSVFLTNIPLWKKFAVIGLQVAGFLTVVPGYHYYGHYFLQWIPFVCLSAGIFIFSLQNLIYKSLKSKAISVAVPLLILLIPVISNLSSLSKYYFSPNHTQILRKVYGLNPFPESKVIADKLNTLMKPEDKLAVFGTEIEMYVYTNKKSPSRFAGSGALLEFPVAQSSDWQREFIADVEKAAPKYLVFFSHAISWMANPKTENLIFPWFDKFRNANYNLIGFADIQNGVTNYVWKPDLDMVHNPPTSKYKIFVFERK